MQPNRAGEIMAQGHVCAESVLLAVCQELGIEVDENYVPKIAYGFAGGLGNTGAVCGAVTGAVMAMGLKNDRPETMEDAFLTFDMVKDFRHRFEEAMGTISCRELTGLDLSTQEGVEQLMTSDVPQKVCFPAVNTAYRLAVELLAGGPGAPANHPATPSDD